MNEQDLEPLPYAMERGRRVLYITYKGDCRFVRQGRRQALYATRTVGDALSCVRPGDILQFLPGKYWPPILYDEDSGNPPVCRPVKLYELRGLPDMPITIRGLGAATVLDGGLGGVPHDSLLPTMKHFAFFKLKDCAWIEFENFQVESCWPCFIYLEDSSYVTVRGLEARDGRYLVYARGRGSHHILLENNRWSQDPTGSVWRDLLWLDAKRKRYFYYNGGLFGSQAIPGDVVLRGNTVSDAFNGMRMKADKKPAYAQNRNVEIYGNTMRRIRDNPVEPERSAENWWVHHNAIRDAHAWVSLDEVSGGFWYFFANTGCAVDLPGSPLDPHRGGKVLKYDAEGDMPDRAVWAFNNSWWLTGAMIKSGSTTRLTHRNTAALFDRPDQDPDRFVGREFRPKAWSPEVSFDWDLSNLPKPRHLEANGQEPNGRFLWRGRYQDPRGGDLRLEGGPPPGCVITLAAGTDWPGEEDWTSGPLSVGAYDVDGEPVAGPPFASLPSPEATKGTAGEEGLEMPRLVRLAVRDGQGRERALWPRFAARPGAEDSMAAHGPAEGLPVRGLAEARAEAVVEAAVAAVAAAVEAVAPAGARLAEDAGGAVPEARLVLTFSVPLAAPEGTRPGEPMRLKGRTATGRFVLQAELAGRELSAHLPPGLEPEAITRLGIPDGLRSRDGKPATLWASVFPGLRFHASRPGEPRVRPPVRACFCDCGRED